MWTGPVGAGGATSAPANDTFINPNNDHRSYAFLAQGTTLYSVCNKGFAGNKTSGNAACAAGAQAWSWQDTPPSSIQNFPNPVVLSADAGINTNEYIYVGTNRGFVFKINAATGVVDAKSGDARRGTCTTDAVIATPSIQLGRFANAAYQAKFGATKDLVIVATHTMCGDSTKNRIIAFFADDLTATPAWIFNKTFLKKVDFISDGPYIDYDNNRIYFGSNLAPGVNQNSLWAVSTLDGSLVWSGNAGSIQNRPQLVYTDETTNPAQGRLYVAANDGSIQAYNINGDGAGNMLPLWNAKAQMPGTITRNLWYENRTGAFNGNLLVVDALGNLRAFHEDRNANTATLMWSQVANSGLFSSAPAVYPAANVAYIGKTDGNLMQIELTHGTYQGEAAVNGGAAATVTDPSVDVQNAQDINVVTVAAGSGAMMSFDTSTFPAQSCTSGSAACVCPAGQYTCDQPTCNSGDPCQVARCAGAKCPGVAAPDTYPSCDCSDSCVDPTTDVFNCGGCGKTCANTETCRASGCWCVSGFTRCGTSCVNLAGDVANCGACGNACGNGKVCSDGKCVNACTGGKTSCSSNCVDTMTDPRYCGGCGTACATGFVCTNGTCGCGPGLTLCGGVCVNYQTDVFNCGGCGVKCGSAGKTGAVSAAGTCVAGMCQTAGTSPAYNAQCSVDGMGFPTGKILCTINNANNQTNCGGSWTGGTCTKGSGRPAADGTACTDSNANTCDCTNADANGVCTGGITKNDTCQGGKCGAATQCYSGATCTLAADKGKLACGTMAKPTGNQNQVCCGTLGCANLLTDPANCGACGATCGSGICVNGRCRGSSRCSFISDSSLNGIAAANLIGADALAFDNANVPPGGGGTCNAYVSTYRTTVASDMRRIASGGTVTVMTAPDFSPLNGVAVPMEGDQIFGALSNIPDGGTEPDGGSTPGIAYDNPVAANVFTRIVSPAPNKTWSTGPFSAQRLNQGPAGPAFDFIAYTAAGKTNNSRVLYFGNWLANGDVYQVSYATGAWVASAISAGGTGNDMAVQGLNVGARITSVAFGKRHSLDAANGTSTLLVAYGTQIRLINTATWSTNPCDGANLVNATNDCVDLSKWSPDDGMTGVPTAILSIAVHPVFGDIYAEVKDNGGKVFILNVDPNDLGARRQKDVDDDEHVNPATGVPVVIGTGASFEGRIAVTPDLNLMHIIPNLDGTPTFKSYVVAAP